MNFDTLTVLVATLVAGAAALPAFGAPGAAAQPAVAPAAAVKPRIEVCFVLDTTGSMSGLIDGAKQKIWSIANEMVRAKPSPDLRLGLVAYRDRGDEYVTRCFDLTNDIDAVYGQLQSFQAAGGGDTPESVNQALNVAVHRMSWSGDRQVLKIIFLVGDAPPHMDYPGEPTYPDICRLAVKRDLIINTVQCGQLAETRPVWKQIASLSEGRYAAIAQSGNMAVLATPVDAELARLNRELGANLLAYGSAAVRGEVAARQKAAENAPASVAADRLEYNVRSGVSVQGEGELLDALQSGRLTLGTLEKDQLPPELRPLDPARLKAEIEKRQKVRADLQARIRQLSQQREVYLAKEHQRLAAEGKGDSFDETVAQAIRAQGAQKAIRF
jgi:Mg-chelatase subunit ChlD